MTTKRFSAAYADGQINPALQLRSGQVVPCKDKVKIPTLRQKRSGWGTRKSEVKSDGMGVEPACGRLVPHSKLTAKRQRRRRS